MSTTTINGYAPFVRDGLAVGQDRNGVEIAIGATVFRGRITGQVAKIYLETNEIEVQWGASGAAVWACEHAEVKR